MIESFSSWSQAQEFIKDVYKDDIQGSVLKMYEFCDWEFQTRVHYGLYVKTVCNTYLHLKIEVIRHNSSIFISQIYAFSSLCSRCKSLILCETHDCLRESMTSFLTKINSDILTEMFSVQRG